MTAADYAAIGLRVGLSVHRQLRTDTKLFCRCPAGRYNAAYDAEVLRHMRPTLSELGEYDPAALMERKTRKNLYYRIHHDTVCTYEFDDTPPFPLNEQALDIALEIALMLNVSLADELHVVRKQCLDGSIPAGFQRTALLGINGSIPLVDRPLGISRVCLEEDSCREVSDEGHNRVFLTDRLGTPLVEITTECDLRTPWEAERAGGLLRRLCRGTGKVRTGLGTGRQDVEVAVDGGAHVEIKSVPRLRRLPRLIYNEARRQCTLLRVRDQLRARGIHPEKLQTHTADVSNIVARSTHDRIRSAVLGGARAHGVALGGFAGLLNEPTQEHTLLAGEFSDRIRVIACLTQLPNMIHSDSASDSLASRDWRRLFQWMRAGEQDAIIIVWGPEEDVRVAAGEIAARARETAEGVPAEARQALPDGTSAFERILPAPGRMYPDTDLPPMGLTRDRVGSIRDALAEPVWEREARYVSWGLSDELAAQMSIHARRGAFERAVLELKSPARSTAEMMLQSHRRMQREGLSPDGLANDAYFPLLEALAGGSLPRKGFSRALRRALQGVREGATAEQAVSSALRESIADTVSQHEPLSDCRGAGGKP